MFGVTYLIYTEGVSVDLHFRPIGDYRDESFLDVPS